MKRKYEMIVIVSPDQNDDIETFYESLKTLIEGYSGNIIERNDWGIKALPYQVKKHSHGYFIFMMVVMPGENVDPLKKELQIKDHVLRYSIYKPNKE